MTWLGLAGILAVYGAVLSAGLSFCAGLAEPWPSYRAGSPGDRWYARLGDWWYTVWFRLGSRCSPRETHEQKMKAMRDVQLADFDRQMAALDAAYRESRGA